MAVTEVEATAVSRASPLSHPSRLAEFLLTGGATLPLLALCFVLEHSLGLDRADLSIGFLTFYGAYLINDPHFSVTYLLFYRHVKVRLLATELPLVQRLRYFFAGFLVPGALLSWAVWALLARSAAALGAMTQLMFLLVGWHYVKQGFGVVTLLSARRGTSYGLAERRVLLAHCFAGWAYAWASP